MLEKWRRAIPNEGKLLQASDYVCNAHFDGDKIIRFFDGNKIVNVPFLRQGAIPSKFHPNCLEYTSKPTPVER